jgi:hypothetical protein
MAMDKTGSIHKDRQLTPSQDFHQLMEKGLSYVQGFSGDIWTDYNAHDPGVTILEQFCYGLTELGYKASFPIEDLLVEAETGRIDWSKNSFYSPALVFSSHPYTKADFRKLLIDTFPEIQNCWLELVYPTGKEEGINGVFQLEVLPSLAFQKELRQMPDRAKSFLSRLHEFLRNNRNLGEDFDPPRLLVPHFVFLRASVEISEGEDPDEVMAEILFALEVHLYHPVAYTNLEELQKAGKRLEEIFSGPRLTRGFIPDSELKERSKVLYTEKFLLLISKIAGVTKCWDLAIDKEGRAKSLSVPIHSYAAINTDPKHPESIYSTLKIYVKGNLQRLDKARVADLLLDLWSKKYRVYQEDLFRENFWSSTLKGKFRNPGNYTSIQHHFPGIYGLRAEGISSHEPPERHAKVRQLKGYLLLMEKHLANFLAQLAHITDFYDQAVIPDQGSYFSQHPESRIGSDELEIRAALDMGFGESGVNPATGETRKDWLKRKNRVLDHLLSRFGEGINDLPFQLSLKLNLVGSEEEMLALLLHQKSRFLRLIPDLSYGSLRAVFTYEGEGTVCSSLEKTLCLLLGIGSPSSLIPQLLPKDVSDQSSGGTGFLKSQSSYAELTEKFRQLSKRERYFPWTTASSRASVSFGKIGIRDLFSRAIDPDSYWISRHPTRMGTIEVLFQKSETLWVSMWEGNREEDALQAIATNIQYFRELNASSEGMFLVDHILLRPLLEGSEYGFVLLDEYGKPTFQSPWMKEESERLAILSKFYQAATDHKAYKRHGDALHLHGKGGELLATFNHAGHLGKEEVIESTSSLARMMSGDAETSGALALREIERLRYRGTLHDQGGIRQRAVVMLRRLKDGKEVREDFFDLKASLILPDWPARFQESHFRYFLTSAVRDRVPAHMEVGVYWLDLMECRAFESAYKGWTELRASNPSNSKLIASAYELYEVLARLKGGEHV